MTGPADEATPDGCCATLGCPGDDAIRGTYADGECFARVSYCSICASVLMHAGFTPDEPAAAAGPQRDHEGGQQ